jgi:hypothetical protein
MATFRTDTEVAERTALFAGDAVAIAGDLGVELDFTEASVDRVEALLAELASELSRGGGGHHEKWTHAVAFGSYLGEVYRRTHGAVWGRMEADDRAWTALSATDRPLVFSPFQQVLERLSGAGDVRSFYSTPGA